MTDRKDTMDGKTGYGDPGSKFFGQVLSTDEEKRLGQDDEMIAEGLLWSEAGTGMYLTIGVSDSHKMAWDRACICAVTEHLGNKALWVMTTAGKPTVKEGGFWGASLELPVDLGADALKQQYVTEWITETMQESWEQASLMVISGDANAPKREKLFMWVATAVERAIREVGL